MSIDTFITPFIQQQFPEFYRDEGPNFVAFVKAYFEWMESEGQAIQVTRTLTDNLHIDTTADEFIKYFKNKYMFTLPDVVTADKRLLTKHILDMFRSKGSSRSYELLFRILFNEDISVYLPGQDVLKASDNAWIVPQYIEVTDSPYLAALVGRQIYNSSRDASAVVENYSTKVVSNKLLNVLTLSSIRGSFKYGQKILCDDLYFNEFGATISASVYADLSVADQSAWSLAFTPASGPLILGSLSSIGIINGGANFKVGEFLKIDGYGSGGVARVVATRDENGKVTFTLLDGGSGFSMNAAVSVTGGGGSGATFRVGGLIDTEIFQIDTDIISDYYNTQLDIDASGFYLRITGTSGVFGSGHTIKSTTTTDVLPLDVTLLVANNLANGENLSNTSLGISALTVTRSDGSYIKVRGADITNANLVNGTVLISNTTHSVVQVNSMIPIEHASGNGVAFSVNSTTIGVNMISGFYVPGSQITDLTSGATATVTSVDRLTNWNFPAVNLSGLDNLDTPIGQSLTIFDIEVGTIAFLSQVDPGIGYLTDPTVSVLEPSIYDLRIQDRTGYKGFNAIVNAHAGVASGVVTAVDIYDSGFGYERDRNVALESTNTQNQTVVTGTTVVDRHGHGQGYFKNRSGFLSDTQHIQDSNYYQTFSYDILASRLKDTYEKFVRDMVHPSGVALFGTFAINSKVEKVSPAVVASIRTP
jgi:hypothetical protein